MRYFCLISCLIIISACSSNNAIEQLPAACIKLDGIDACYDEEKATYLIEENASVKIGGMDSLLVNKIIQLWDETYPEHGGLIVLNDVEYSDVEAMSLKALDYDIVYTSEENAAYYLDQLGKLDKHLKQIYSHSNVLEQSLEIMQDYFIPFTSDGAAFIYNKTMLKELGIDVATDQNNDGMPDSIDSWEKIFLIADMISTKHPLYRKKRVLITFPFSLNESFLSYFMLTSNNFRIFNDNDGKNIGFESTTFLDALGFIEEASTHIFGESSKVEKKKTIYTPYDASGYIYRYDKVYTNEISPFGLVTNWMDLTSYMKSLKNEIVVTPIFPTYQDTLMVPLVSHNGFVYKQTTQNKSATFAVLDFLHSDDVYQLIVDNTALIPYYYDDIKIDFTNKTNTKNRMISYSLSDNIPLIALPDNVYKRAFSSYFEMDIMSVIRALWDKTITKEEAQVEFVQMYQNWYNEACDIVTLEEELKHD